MKLLHIHAHHDDFEFVAAGTFETWRHQLGNHLQARVIVGTDGKAGHHFRSREETGRLRDLEQQASAAIGGWEYQKLVDSQGMSFREGCFPVDSRFLAALWKTIRDFEPDYLFCPPLPLDTFAGIHPDHVSVAEGIRRVAYMINVPHAFTPEYPADESKSTPCKVPVIINVHDGYMSGANAFDLAVNVESAFDSIVDMTWCHQSQISEWLPWVDRHSLIKPESKADWSGQVRQLMARRNQEMGVEGDQATEYFKITAWGRVPSAQEIIDDFPALTDPTGTLAHLEGQLAKWR
jgi:LmbE family N-acetylglucosaminyl deacetylase